MSQPYVISPDAIYDDVALCKTLGVKLGSLGRARKSGELRFTKRGGRVLYLGRWVQEWLTRDDSSYQSTGIEAQAVSQ